MPDIEMIDVLVGTVLPALISLVMQGTWSKPVRNVVSATLCVVAGVLVAWGKGELDPANALASVVAVYLAATTVYHKLGDKLGLPALERMTSPAHMKLPADDEGC